MITSAHGAVFGPRTSLATNLARTAINSICGVGQSVTIGMAPNNVRDFKRIVGILSANRVYDFAVSHHQTSGCESVDVTVRRVK